MTHKILIIDDEEKFARFLEMELNYEGYKVAKAFDGREGLEKINSEDYDLVLLDIMLPGLNGMEVLRRLRRFSSIPVIMLTALDSVIDKVSGLDGGANDYITKPFAIEELLARIRNVLRRNFDNSDTQIYKVGNLELNTAKRVVSMNNTPIELTKREFDLLHFLLKNKGIVLTRETLLEKIWGFEYEGETNVVDVYIRFLRGKIDEVFAINLISTVRGVGYVIRDEL